MREYKFRAWTDNLKDGGEMYYGRYDRYYNITFSPVGYGIGNPTLKIMQYTGLKDKNDKPIYEGDIMQYYLEGNKKGGDVKYIDGSFYVTFYTSQCTRRTQILSAFLRDKKTSIVIGNIYQNPELLNTSTS